MQGTFMIGKVPQTMCLWLDQVLYLGHLRNNQLCHSRQHNQNLWQQLHVLVHKSDRTDPLQFTRALVWHNIMTKSLKLELFYSLRGKFGICDLSSVKWFAKFCKLICNNNVQFRGGFVGILVLIVWLVLTWQVACNASKDRNYQSLLCVIGYIYAMLC